MASKPLTRWPSPNFDDRTMPVCMLVLHYTGMQNTEAALQRLSDPVAKVSAHYLVDKTGQVFSLVPENKRAWHAGLAHWRGMRDINNASIGIEIANGGHDFGLPDFTHQQIKAVIRLCQDIISRHQILPVNIVGHNEIAPTRKLDPGEKFPWAQLAKAGIGLWPDEMPPAKLQSSDIKAEAVQLLQTIGYETSTAALDGPDPHSLIHQFQRRYLPDDMSGTLDEQTLRRLQQMADAYTP